MYQQRKLKTLAAMAVYFRQLRTRESLTPQQDIDNAGFLGFMVGFIAVEVHSIAAKPVWLETLLSKPALFCLPYRVKNFTLPPIGG